MKELVYVSTAVSLSDSDIGSIVDESQRNNVNDGITGFLIFNGRNFLQFLEGDDARLSARVEKIKADRRHDGMVIVHEATKNDRSTSQWSMQFIDLSKAYEARCKRLSTEIDTALIDSHVMRIVENFTLLN